MLPEIVNCWIEIREMFYVNLFYCDTSWFCVLVTKCYNFYDKQT